MYACVVILGEKWQVATVAVFDIVIALKTP